ncbi:11053_t:CDS:1, partial [Dentiscutata erythropus]
MAASDYIRVDDNLAIEEVVLNETAILQEILPHSDSNSSDDESDVEIEKISHSIALEQCKSLIQYIATRA